MHHERIKTLARKMLDKRELELAVRFAKLMAESGKAIDPLILDILPTYYEGNQTLEPRAVYRSLMYVHNNAVTGDARTMIHMSGDHLESCLQGLGAGDKPLGWQINILQKKGMLSDDLASQLSAFNKDVYVSAKHTSSIKAILESRIDKRTFTALDAAYAFLMVRRLSIELFKLLKSHGTVLPQDWKDFKDEWSQKYGK